MKWLNSLDESLYEVMSWILFFQLTLLRTIVRPLRTMDEAVAQAALPTEDQYAALISPPLYLALALLLAHGVATALGRRMRSSPTATASPRRWTTTPAR